MKANSWMGSKVKKNEKIETETSKKTSRRKRKKKKIWFLKKEKSNHTWGMIRCRVLIESEFFKSISNDFFPLLLIGTLVPLSMRITSAPKSASIIPKRGPGPIPANSSTLTPDSDMSLSCRWFGQKQKKIKWNGI